ncbi:ABC transporter permease [Halomonas halophila]|uniref:ABC transporter permease n=2 Tax=Halomonadaceae TaxID=28256 RepID=A0ABQ0U1D4_9GAMM|nr:MULTISPECIES: FtsX-like permease family protein [Halomonas]MDR5888860.1 ABC transporter permease [Halomonas salina]WJY08038.1 ABC transporter permease [Halomonas halophila]GEK72180.1 ABC transporter permease [Halomonas halophila]
MMRHAVALSWKGLRRDLRAGDVRALFLALTLAVAAATMIGFFLDRLERGLTRQAGQLLGGDVVLEQSRPFDPELRRAFEDAGLALSDQVDMVSMVSAGEAFQPVGVKAVDDAYPHYGESVVDRGSGPEALPRGPERGGAWVAPRLAQLLDLELGDTLRLGQAELEVSGVIEREADPSAGFSSFNPRLMVHVDDLEATGLIQPGSRIEYELLAAGPPEAVEAITPRLERLRAEGVEVQDVRRDRPRLGSALSRADRYLSLAGLAAVLLAGVAVAMATRRYVERHLDTAALLRCFGARQAELVRLFALQLLWLALAASALGALLGLAGQALLLALLGRLLAVELPPPGPMPLALGVLTALAVLAGFAGPTLLRLRRVSALKVLRRELDPLPASAWWVVGAAALVFGALLWLYSGDPILSLSLLLGGGLALAVLWGLGGLLLGGVLALCSRLPARGGAGYLQALRLGGRQLARRRAASLGQLLAFSVALFAMAMIALVRGDLLDAWREQLPENTPNQFAINIQPGERDAFAAALNEGAESRSDLYPMVRGRLTAIDGAEPREAVPAEARGDNALRRELNLTWRADPPEGNRLVAGEWFDAEAATGGEAATPVPISLESGLAGRLGLELGDVLTFTVGSATIDGEITSLRDLDWDSFRPNFYVIFPPGVLERFGHSYITAFHLAPDERALPGRLVRDFPGVTLLDVEAILERVREVLSQVTRAVELVLVLVLLAGISVLHAALAASLPVRAHEAGLLRVFGAGDRLLRRVQGAEFALLGLASGLLAAALTELAAAGLYGGWLDLTPRWHPALWLALPLGGALLVGAIGQWLSRGIRRRAPAESLGLLGEA